MVCDSQCYLSIAYGVGISLLCLITLYALYMGWRLRHRNKEIEEHDGDYFITARKRFGTVRIGASFFASAVGAWVITAPSSYSSYAGLLGLCMYSLSSGIPFLMVAYAGTYIQKLYPNVISLIDFVGWRFGFVPKTLVLLMVLLNLSIAMLAELVSIGYIFRDYVGSPGWIIILVIGLLTLTYTTYGGLVISIYTDSIQAATALLLFTILMIFVASDFRPDPLPAYPNCEPGTYVCISGAPNCAAFDAVDEACPISGYSAILVMPLSLFMATVFSEAMWQKVWASESERTVKRGAWLGVVLILGVVFFSGYCGLLAQWAGLITYPSSYSYDPDNPVEATNANLYLFQVLGGGKSLPPSTLFNWIGVLVVILACVMCMGAVDSLQNGIASAIYSYISRLPVKPGMEKLTHSIWSARLLQFCMNAILLGIGGWLSSVPTVGPEGSPPLSVLELFLLGNMLACCIGPSVLFGLSKRLAPYYGGAGMVFSAVWAFACTCIYGTQYFFNKYKEDFYDFYGHAYTAGDVGSAFFFTWIGNGYAWDFFLIPFCVSIGTILLTSAITFVYTKATGKKIRVPSMAGKPEANGEPAPEAEAEAEAEATRKEGELGSADAEASADLSTSSSNSPKANGKHPVPVAEEAM
jgi:Na+/proline symporter